MDGQRIDANRYSQIPRTLSFLFHGEQVLLLKLGSDRAGWSGLYNGIGGHVEQGEDVLTAAIREVEEEAGLHVPNQRLCGVVMIDRGQSPGIALYVFVGELESDWMPGDHDDQPAWIPIDQLPDIPTVEDLPTLLPAALRAHREGSLFHASYSYASDGALQISLKQ